MTLITLIVYLEAVIQGLSLKVSPYFIYTWWIHVVGSISSGAAVTMPAVLVGLGSFVGVPQVFYLFLCELLFYGDLPLLAGSQS